MFDVAAVDPKDVDGWWPQFEPHIDRAVHYGMGMWTSEDLHEFVRSGEGLLIGVFDGQKVLAGLIARVIAYPRCKILEILVLGGSRFHEWSDLMNVQMDGLKEATGCASIEFRGRRGWAKLLAPYGYEPRSVFFEKVTP